MRGRWWKVSTGGRAEGTGAGDATAAPSEENTILLGCLCLPCRLQAYLCPQGAPDAATLTNATEGCRIHLKH